MRNKFKIILPDGSEYKPPKHMMLVMTQDGVVYLCEYIDWQGWYMGLLSDSVKQYDIVFQKAAA